LRPAWWNGSPCRWHLLREAEKALQARGDGNATSEPPFLAYCGAKGIRTPDLFDANEALYQLSYNPGTLPLAEEPQRRFPLGYKFSGRFANQASNVSRPQGSPGAKFLPSRRKFPMAPGSGSPAGGMVGSARP
jgi:hypothetical protein